MPHPERDPQLAALGREQERLSHRLAAVESLVRMLADDIATLAADGAVEEEAPQGLQSWLVAEDADRAHSDLTDLVEWLDGVYLAYPGTALPACWLWHPAVVEELWWLRQAWADAYTGPGACWTRVADWHDRMRPGVTRRIREAHNGCELGLHVAGARHAHRALAVPLSAAAAEVAERWATTRGQPEPTDAQLAAARRHDDEQYRRSYR